MKLVETELYFSHFKSEYTHVVYVFFIVGLFYETPHNPLCLSVGT